MGELFTGKMGKQPKVPPAPSSELIVKLRRLEETIGHKYKDISLLRDALVHTSYVNESGVEGLEDNERLEFVGDAVLQFIASEYLYCRHPGESEGVLTILRSSIVGRKHCAMMAKQLRLDEYVLVGKGERSAGGVRKSILANAFEALIASIYFDGGLDAARRFVLKALEESLREKPAGDENFKARLQSLCQKTPGVLPSYRLVSAKGPEHQKTFEVEVSIKGVPYGRGKGPSKKAAEQEAARVALEKVSEGPAE